MLRSGELTSFDLVSHYFDRIEQLNPHLNAFACLIKQCALKQAEEADITFQKGGIIGSLHGIPISIKDNIEVEHSPTTAGFKPFKNHTSKGDSHFVSELKKEGAIVIGKTNLPALTFDLQTNNKLFGRTNNPWNIDHTSGGSSGGCAAAVSSGMSPISFCNDSGGSIRIPAHFCGVVGFKASFGGIDSNGIITQIRRKVEHLKMRTLFSLGMIAKSVGDIQQSLKVVGTEKLLPASKKDRSSSNLKFLWMDELDGLEVDHQIKGAMRNLRSTLKDSGATIVDFTEDQFNFNETIRMWGHLSNYETGNELPPFTRSLGNLIMKRKYSKIPMYTDLLKPISAKKYKKLRQRHEALKQQFETLLDSYDGLILPVSSVVSFPHQKPDRRIGHLGIYTTPLSVNDKQMQYAVAIQSYSLPFNVLESPVVSLPIALSDENLPIGIQVVGKKNKDFELLEVASALEKTIPTIGDPEV